MPQPLTTALEISGLSPKAAKAYLALLELGEGTISQIASKAQLKRPITYLVIAELVQAGYASTLPGHKISHYRAVEPVKLYHRLQSRIYDFQQALPSFNALYNRNPLKPKIQYFQGKDGVQHVYRDMEQASEGWFITSVSHIEKCLPIEVERWTNGLKSGKFALKAKHLLAQTPADLAFGRVAKNHNQQIRYLPKNKRLDIDFALYDNKCALTSFEQEPFIVVLESESLVSSLKVIFELAWQHGVVLE